MENEIEYSSTRIGNQHNGGKNNCIIEIYLYKFREFWIERKNIHRASPRIPIATSYRLVEQIELDHANNWI